MDAKSEIRDFLTSRRARLQPEEAGLTSYGSRRVPGLRREEVAVLAGISVPYYTRLERGELAGVSDGVIEALARALKLNDAERAHLWNLARAARPTDAPRRRKQRKPVVRPSVQRILDSMTEAAAFVHNARLDNLATSLLGRALYCDLFASTPEPAVANNARYVFLQEGSRDFYVDWERAADDVVGILRTEAGRNPNDRDLSDLVGELSTRSQEFRIRWAAHNVRLHYTGVKHLHHPVVGELILTYDRMELSADTGLSITTWTAEAGSNSQKALGLLGSWAATELPTAHPGPASGRTVTIAGPSRSQ